MEGERQRQTNSDGTYCEVWGWRTSWSFLLWGVDPNGRCNMGIDTALNIRLQTISHVNGLLCFAVCKGTRFCKDAWVWLLFLPFQNFL